MDLRLRSKLLAPMWILFLVNSCMMQTVEASPLSQAQKQKNKLQSQIVQTKKQSKTAATSRNYRKNTRRTNTSFDSRNNQRDPRGGTADNFT